MNEFSSKLVQKKEELFDMASKTENRDSVDPVLVRKVITLAFSFTVQKYAKNIKQGSGE